MQGKSYFDTFDEKVCTSAVVLNFQFYFQKQRISSFGVVRYDLWMVGSLDFFSVCSSIPHILLLFEGCDRMSFRLKNLLCVRLWIHSIPNVNHLVVAMSETPYLRKKVIVQNIGEIIWFLEDLSATRDMVECLFPICVYRKLANTTRGTMY